METFKKPHDGKLGWNATWCMAVGGMVGGGIFSVLGVVVAIAGSLAWGSFVFAGLIALSTAYSYVYLAVKHQEAGGAFLFLRKIGYYRLAGGLARVLIIGYVLTMSVYAYTFGHYLAEVVGLSAFNIRVAEAAIIGSLVVVNLLGVSEAAWVEIVTVWGKILVLLGLGIIGVWHWHPEHLAAGIQGKGFSAAIVGGASIFMAYEGFQLLVYNYHEIRHPARTLKTAVLSAVVAVMIIYVLVALGAACLVGAEVLVQQKEVALAAAGQQALGNLGRWLVSIAAAFSTASAINATLFATARLSRTVTNENELPKIVGHLNRRGVPDLAIIFLGSLAALLAVIGSLSALVEVASLTFLITFAMVNVIGVFDLTRGRWISMIGAAGAMVATTLLVKKLIGTDPEALFILFLLILVAFVQQPILRTLKKRIAPGQDS